MTHRSEKPLQPPWEGDHYWVQLLSLSEWQLLTLNMRTKEKDRLPVSWVWGGRQRLNIRRWGTRDKGNGVCSAYVCMRDRLVWAGGGGDGGGHLLVFRFSLLGH